MRKRVRRLALACDLPEDTLAGGARVTLLGRGSALVEGQRGVVELESGRIRLRTAQGTLCILGTGLAIGELSADAAMITGERIDSAGYDGAPGGRG